MIPPSIVFLCRLWPFTSPAFGGRFKSFSLFAVFSPNASSWPRQLLLDLFVCFVAATAAAALLRWQFISAWIVTAPKKVFNATFARFPVSRTPETHKLFAATVERRKMFGGVLGSSVPIGKNDANTSCASAAAPYAAQSVELSIRNLFIAPVSWGQRSIITF